MSFKERLKAARDLGAAPKQHELEMRTAYMLIAERKPKVFVEIGSHAGGTLCVYADACTPRATVIAIDAGTRRQRKFLKRALGALKAEGYNAHWVRGISQDPETVNAVFELHGGKIDLLHIDGSHKLDAVLCDWQSYSGYMADDGIVLFHDIHALKQGTRAAWDQIKQKGAYVEISAPDVDNDKPMGIGVLFMDRLRWGADK